MFTESNVEPVWKHGVASPAQQALGLLTVYNWTSSHKYKRCKRSEKNMYQLSTYVTNPLLDV